MSDTKIKVMVVDGEIAFMRGLQRNLRNLETVELTQAFRKGRQALHYLRQNKVDILFLNPEMDDLNGFDLLSALEEPPLTIMVSSRMEYAYFAYQFRVFHYLLQPVTSAKFDETFQAAVEELKDRKLLAEMKGKGEG